MEAELWFSVVNDVRGLNAAQLANAVEQQVDAVFVVPVHKERQIQPGRVYHGLGNSSFDGVGNSDAHSVPGAGPGRKENCGGVHLARIAVEQGRLPAGSGDHPFVLSTDALAFTIAILRGFGC